MSDVIARTSGTTDATIAPNANSRMMNVSGIVSLSDSSRSLEMSSVISSLMNVKLTTWIVRSGFAARASSMIELTGSRSVATWAESPGTRAAIRTVVPSALMRPGLGRGQERVHQLVEARGRDAVDVRLRRAELRDQLADRRLERRVRHGAVAAIDDDEELFVRVVLAAGVEDLRAPRPIRRCRRSGRR